MRFLCVRIDQKKEWEKLMPAVNERQQKKYWIKRKLIGINSVNFSSCRAYFFRRSFVRRGLYIVQFRSL